jgi:hypothetical protein
VQTMKGDDMTAIVLARRSILSMLLIPLFLAGCGGGRGDDEDGADQPDVVEDGEDGVLPDGVDAVPDTPVDADPDVMPDVPCYCGNAVHEPECELGAEECDDGNYESGDDCIACRLARCGDGFWRSVPASPGDAEECDDGANGDPDDGCRDDCTYSCHSDGDCDDGSECTADSCDTMYFHSCYTVPSGEGSVCGSGDICTGVGTCISGACVTGSAMDCDDSEPCTTDTCNPTEGCVHTGLPEGTSCDDGFFCWTGDQCWGMGFCSGVPESPCDDGNPCTVDECDEVTDSCSHSSPTYRTATCGGDERGNLMSGPDEYGSIVCPDGTHAAGGADQVYEVTPGSSGTLAVTVDTTESLPGTELYILTDPCSLSSCLGWSAGTAAASVTGGVTYYVVVDSPSGGGAYRFTVSCP